MMDSQGYVPLMPSFGAVNSLPDSLHGAPLTRDNVVQWLVKASEPDVIDVLNELGEERPTLLARLLTSQWTSGNPRGSHPVPSPLPAQRIPSPRDGIFDTPTPSKAAVIPTGDVPMVQFSALYYYCDEDDQQVVIEIIRIGDRSKRSEVWFETRDASAKAGVRYEETRQRVVIEAGEPSVRTAVKLIEDKGKWNTTLAFEVRLLHEGAVNAHFGKYHWRAHVQVMDNDPFPSARCEKVLREEEVAESHHTFHGKRQSLYFFLEYFKMNYRNPVVRHRTWWVCAIMQLDNLYYFWELLLSEYLIDRVMRTDLPAHTKSHACLIIVMLSIAPFMLIHFCNWKRVSMGHVGGPSRKVLQSGLFRKYLEFTREARTTIREGDLVMSISRDSVYLVGHGYKGVLRITKHIGHLVAAVTFQIVAPHIFKRSFSWFMLLPLSIYPPFLIFFLFRQCKQTVSQLHERNVKQTAFVDHIMSTEDNYQLVSGFRQQSVAIKKFEQRIDAYNTANRQANVELLNNEYSILWLTHILIGLWIFWGGRQAAQGVTTLGMFLVNLRIFKKMGKEMANIYQQLLAIEGTFPYLLRVAKLLNLKTDLETQALISRHNNVSLRHMLDEQAKKKLREGAEFDALPIMISDLDVKHSSAGIRITTVNGTGMFVVKQGELACLLGPPNTGKSTLLKMVSGAALPTAEQVKRLIKKTERLDRIDESLLENIHVGEYFFIPPHLRTIHVTSDVFFLEGSLMENLTFGVDAENPEVQDGSLVRVLEICGRLGLDTDIQDMIRDEVVHRWVDVLSHSQMHLLHIARALIANPEITCIHKPLVAFGERHAENIMGLLLESVRLRGLCRDEAQDPIEKKRPRTCVITTALRMAPLLRKCDRVYLIDHTGIADFSDNSEAINDACGLDTSMGLSETVSP